jgi:hypothetical protein
MRMAVEGGRRTMGSPASVCNASVGVKGLGHVDARVGNELLEFCNLAHLFEGEDLILLVTINSEACRVVPSVF